MGKTDQLAGLMKLVVMWVSSSGRVIPKNDWAAELLSSLTHKDNVLKRLLSFKDYHEIREYAGRHENRTVRLQLNDENSRTLVWELVPGRGGVACIAMDWRMPELPGEGGETMYREILLNILPEYIVEELVSKRSVHPKVYRHSTIMFTDVVRFSRLAFHLDPVTLIRKLDSYFSLYDAVMDQFGMEKIKTIGDSYMCVSGIPVKKKSHAVDCCLAALSIRGAMKRTGEPNLIDGIDINNWSIRIGIHSGPCISGVVGNKKYTFDIWGDTVNIAARMERSGEPGSINISESTFREVVELFECRYRGEQEVRHIGPIGMYFLDRIKPGFSEDGVVPNQAFRRYYHDNFYRNSTQIPWAVLPAILREPEREKTREGV